MKTPWFRPWGWVHRPAGTTGWLVTLVVLAVLVRVFLVVDSRSVSDTLIGVSPWAWILLATLNWVASKTTR